MSSKNIFKRASLGFAAALVITGSALAVSNPAPSHESSNVTVQELNQKANVFLGKQVTLNGQIDRILGSGAYVVADAKDTKDPLHRVLIFTVGPQKGNQNPKQNGGTTGVHLKEGDSVKVSGTVEQFAMGSNSESYAPKSNSENIIETQSVTPVLVVQPGGIQES
jgi:hypothetical protein